MDEESIGLVRGLAKLAKERAHALGLLARVHEDQALAPARVLKDVSDAGVGILWGGIVWRQELLLSGGRDGNVCGVVFRRVLDGVLRMWRFLLRGSSAGGRSGKFARFGIRFICAHKHVFYRGGACRQRFDRNNLGGLWAC